MGGGHDHAAGTKNEGRLIAALSLTAIFLIVEVVAGLLTRSLALLSDAAHMFTDVAGLAIALVAVRISKRPADRQRTFGYYRFEILAAAFNAVLLFLVAGYILFEAYERFREPPAIQSIPMLTVAVLGLIVNFISMRLLGAGKDESLNVKGAYLEVWSDMLGSLGVIVAAILIYFTGWVFVDAIVAVGIGLWVLPRTWELLKETTNILLQGVPRGMNVQAIENALRSMPEVSDIHNLHIWALTSGRNVISVHIITGPLLDDANAFRLRVEKMLHADFGLEHSTVQLEDVRGHGGHVEPHT